MDNTKLAMDLMRYVESHYPLTGLRYRSFRRQSAKRWAVFEYAKILLDHPNKSPYLLLELFIGRLACLINHLSAKDDERYSLYTEALSVLMHVEDEFINL